MPGATTQTKKVTKATIDFTNVREGGAPAYHGPAGDYLLEVADVDIRPTNDGTSKNVNWVLKIVKGPGRGTVYHRNNLKPQSLWSLRQFLTDLLDKEIERKSLGIDFAKFVGKRVGAYLDDESYTDSEGKERITSRIQETYPASKFEGGDAPAAEGVDEDDAGTSSLNGFSPEAGDEVVDELDADEDIEPLEVDEDI